MAPSPARIPKLMFIPSKAGPAAVEVAQSRPPWQSAISPLVPMSTKRTEVCSSWSRTA